jgi:hypothetical protein
MSERSSSVTMRLVEGDSDGNIVTVEFETAAGSLLVMAEVHVVGRTAYASGLHTHSNDRGMNAFGWVQLRALAWAALDWLGDNYDELVIKGAVRTSGANPGRRPRDLRFTRRLRATPDVP